MTDVPRDGTAAYSAGPGPVAAERAIDNPASRTPSPPGAANAKKPITGAGT